MKHTIKINLYNNGAECRPIRLRVTFGGIRMELFSRGCYDGDKWNFDMSRPKTNTRNSFRQSAAEINRLINDEIEFIDTYFNECEFRDAAPSPTELRQRFNDKFKSTVQNTAVKTAKLLDMFDAFTASMDIAKSWSENTRKKYKTLRNLISKLNVTTMDEPTCDNFVSEMISTGHRNVSIEKNFGCLAAFARWLYQKKIIEFDIDTYELHLKKVQKTVIYLEYDELMALWNYDFSARPYLENTRDVFIFCCFSGLRYSDAAALKHDDIKNDCINIVTQKTHDPLRIELNSYTRVILNKYKKYDDTFALRVISNQKYNTYIKECCKIVGIDTPTKITTFIGARRVEIEKPKYEFVSSHCARRTFVVECLRRGIPSEVIIQWTGHKDFQAMKPYFAIVDATKKNAMSKFDT